MTSILSQIDQALVSVATDDPGALGYLAAYFRARAEALPPEALALVVSAVERHAPEGPTAAEARYAELRTQLQAAAEAATMGMTAGEEAALGRVITPGKRRRLGEQLARAMSYAGLGASASGVILSAVAGSMTGAPGLLAVGGALALSWGLQLSWRASRRADRASLAAVRAAEAQSERAQAERDRRRTALELLRASEEAKWVADLVTRHPALAFRELEGVAADRRDTTYRA